MTTLNFSQDDRLLVIAPHPDDETLGTGGVLHCASALGIPVRVVFLTDGDRNDWPQRVMERRWFLDAEARKGWGQRRRREALDALKKLEVPASAVHFLALPDLGLTSLLLENPEQLLVPLTSQIVDFQPTRIFAPSHADLHPDHNAAALALDLILQRGKVDRVFMLYHYAIHGPVCESPIILPLTEELKKKKLAALFCHESQMLLSRKRFTSYVTDKEQFSLTTEEIDHPCAEFDFRSGQFRGKIRQRYLFGSAKLYLLWLTADGEVRSKVFSAKQSCDLRFPEDLSALYVKLSYRPIFLDQAGWRAVYRAPIVMAHELSLGRRISGG